METGIEEDWEMVDYYPPSPLKDEQQKSQVRWVRVIHIGKKVVIAGLVLSSLPILLPPLVVISALGLALSVPYGVVLASYACTHKLMTKLLPSPAPPTHQHELEGFEDMENEFDEVTREEPKGNNDVVKEKDETEEKDENKENGINEKQGENFSQEIIITEAAEKDEDEQNGTNEKQGEDFLQEKNISETKREEKDGGEENITNEKEREKIIIETKRGEKDESKDNGTSENILQEKITSEPQKVEKMKRGSKETAKQRKKKKNEGKRKDGEGDPPKLESAAEVLIIQEDTNQGNIHEKLEVTAQDDSGGTVNSIESTVIADEGKGTEDKDIHSEDQ